MGVSSWEEEKKYLAVAEQLIPFFTAEFAYAVILGGEGVLPHETVGRVFDAGGHHVVAVLEAELLQCRS